MRWRTNLSSSPAASPHIYINLSVGDVWKSVQMSELTGSCVEVVVPVYTRAGTNIRSFNMFRLTIRSPVFLTARACRQLHRNPLFFWCPCWCSARKLGWGLTQHVVPRPEVAGTLAETVFRGCEVAHQTHVDLSLQGAVLHEFVGFAKHGLRLQCAQCAPRCTAPLPSLVPLRPRRFGLGQCPHAVCCHASVMVFWPFSSESWFSFPDFLRFLCPCLLSPYLFFHISTGVYRYL